MVVIPKNVADLFVPDTVKVLVTCDRAGQPHAIACGSIDLCPLEVGKVLVGEILMKKAAENLKNTKKASILLTSGTTSYELILENPERITSGRPLDKMNLKLSSLGLKANAVWCFNTVAIYDQSATPAAGTRIA
jgi:hypothetical protein